MTPSHSRTAPRHPGPRLELQDLLVLQDPPVPPPPVMEATTRVR